MTEYITKRQILLKRQTFLINAIESAQNALNGLLNGDIQSYSLGQWSITRTKPDLDKLQKYINQCMVELDAINNILTGKSPRKVTTCIYANPQGVRWWDML